MTTKTPRIDLRLSRESIADVQQFRSELENTQRRAAELRQDMKQITDLLKSVRAREIFGRPGQGGVGTYLAGQQFLEGQRVNQMQRLGTLSGQIMENNRRTLQYARQGLKLHADQARLQEAQNLNLRTQTRTLNKITDLQQAKNRLAAAEIRLGLEAYNGNERAARSAQRIVNVLRERVQLLQQENRERERAARAQAAQRARMTDTQIVDRQRSLTMQRLFGDGGAGLFGIQAGIMANYMIMNEARTAVSNAATFTVELDEALHNLQAITATTDGAMESLSNRLVQIAETTKFTAVEVANAAVTLGQAGLSTKEIEDSVEAVTLLATATGTDLPRAVDIATSVLGVFSMESGQMADVAHIMTEAVNSSKLNIEKLTLGLQYSGNIAAQSGVRFDELAAALGAMANAGIRAGSTLGTGMRQILISLQDPSGDFLETLNRLGVSIHDVDLRTQGLYGVLSNLRTAGFTAGDAIRSFEVRAAAAYNALANNLNQMIDLEDSFQNTTAAARANEVQMRALANQGRLFAAAFGALSATAFEPLKILLRDFLSLGADFMSWLRESKSLVQGFTTVITGAAVAWGLWRFGRLLTGLARLTFGVRQSNLVITQWSRAAKGASSSTGLFAGSLTNLNRYMRVSIARAGLLRTTLLTLGGPLGLLSAAAGIAVGAFLSLRTEAALTGDVIDQALTVFDDATGEMEQAATRIENVDARLQELLDRYEILGRDSRLLQSEINSIKNQFWELGLTVNESEETVDGLIGVLRRLRAELQEEYVARIRVAIEGGRAAIRALQLNQGDQFETLLNNLPDSGTVTDRYTENFTTPVRDLVARSDARAELLNQVRAIITPLADEDATTDQARSVVTEITDMLSAAREVLDDENASETDEFVANDQIEVLAQALVDAREILATIRDREALETEIDRNSRLERVEAERLNPSVATVFDGANELRTSITTRFGVAADATQGQGAIAQYEAALQVRADIDAEVEALRRSLEVLSQEGLVSQENIDAVEQLLAEAAGRVQADVAALAEAAGQVEAELANTQVRQARDQVRGFRSRVRSAESADEITVLLEEQTAAITEYAAMRRAQIEQAVNDPDLRTSALEELEGEISGMLEEAQTSSGEAVDDILEQVAEEDAETRRNLAQIDLDRAENHLSALEQQLQWAQTIGEANRVYRQIIAALMGVTSAQSAVDALETGDDPEVAEALAQQRTEEAEAALAKARADLDRATNRINRRSASAARQSERDDPQRKWVQSAEAQVQSITLGLEDQTLAINDGASALESIFDEAASRLQSVNSELVSLRARLLNGTLTADEQERLNALVGQHVQLTDFIQKNEQQILEIKLRQGEVQEALTGTVENWMNANLDIGQTLFGGITNALNTARSSLSEFFTEWSNGAKKGGEAFREMASSILQSIHRIFAEMLSVYILQKALGWAGFTGGGDFGALFQASTGVPLKEGGRVEKYDRGGKVRGQLQRDSVRADLMPDEYVLRASAAKAIGYDNLDQINAMGNRATEGALHRGIAQDSLAREEKPRSINLYMVDDRSQVPALGPMDVIAVIDDNIARGGSTKRLIKSIQTGAI